MSIRYLTIFQADNVTLIANHMVLFPEQNQGRDSAAAAILTLTIYHVDKLQHIESEASSHQNENIHRSKHRDWEFRAVGKSETEDWIRVRVRVRVRVRIYSTESKHFPADK